MAEKKVDYTYDRIVSEVDSGIFRPVYYLMGEESYYIDLLSELIVNRALREEEKDFNFSLFYGDDVSVREVVTLAKEFPLLSERRVVLVREAQLLKDIDNLQFYLKNPQRSTVLIMCHKNGKLNQNRRVAHDIVVNGVLFESKKLYDNQLPAFVGDYAKGKNVVIDPKALSLICEYVGNDLKRLAAEVDKLIISLPDGERLIESGRVEEQIGISREYNNYEFVESLLEKDVLKANRIVHYFEDNPKNFSLQLTIAVLFGTFSNIMLAHYARNKTEEGLSEYLGVPRWKVRREVLPALRNYSARKTMGIISMLRQTDAKSKGVNNSLTGQGDLLRELTFFILH